VGFSDHISDTNSAPLIPTEQSTEIIKMTKEASAMLQLAKRLPDLPRKTRTLKVEDSLANVYMVNGPSGANAPGLKQTSDMGWRDVVLTAEELAVIVPISQEQLDDAMVPIWPEVREQIAAKMGAAVDEAMLGGTVGGVAVFASWPTGGAIAHAIAAGNTCSLAAFADIYDALLTNGGVFNLMELDGYTPDAVLATTTVRSVLRGCRDANGQPIFNRVPGQGMTYELDGVPCLFPKNASYPGATNLLAIQRDQIVYAMRQDLSYTLATEGVITDGAGNVLINLFQQDMVALRAVLRIGFAFPNPVNLMRPAIAARSPFSVLTA
jgi:HK97 family phage major capsid protein